MLECFIGVDVGLTTAKASAYDSKGRELHTVSAANPRISAQAGFQEIDMLALWGSVGKILHALSKKLEEDKFVARAIGVTGSGNGAYLVDGDLQPVRQGIASTDTRAESMLDQVSEKAVEDLRLLTGARPWAAQTSLLIRWLSDHEPETLARARWSLSCKDWITACLTKVASADLSDGSGAGLVNLRTGQWEPSVWTTVGLDESLSRLLPELHASDAVVGAVTAEAHATTGLPFGVPVIAGCIDVLAAPIGAGSVEEFDVTVIAGTWGINSVVHRIGENPPDTTLNVLSTIPGLVFAQEDAPTSMANLEWFAKMLEGFGVRELTGRNIVERLGNSTPGAKGMMYLPFVHGAPQHRGASASFLGARDHHTADDLCRALIEGVTHYHRVQMRSLESQGVTFTSKPWTLAGGGAKNPVWAQIFSNVLGHALRTQTERELGTRGAARLAFCSQGGDQSDWSSAVGSENIVYPNQDLDVYREQGEVFDLALKNLSPWWSSMASRN